MEFSGVESFKSGKGPATLKRLKWSTRQPATKQGSGSDGLNGEYCPQPVDLETPKLRRKGQGLTGIHISDLDISEKFQLVRSGQLGSMHSWELVTAVDGPGTRMTVFLAGCPLRCLYCHNPDTMFRSKGNPVKLDELVNRLMRYRRVFAATGGGLTISGGEPLMQPAFVKNLLRQAKSMGIHTCIDTSGYLGRNASDEMLADLDMVLLDVKSGDPEIYHKVTGKNLAPTIEFGDRLSKKNISIWVRFVCVPGLTDSAENVTKVADIVSRWDSVKRVEVLPFHQMGRDKWETLGIDYKLKDVMPPSSTETERVRDIFRSRGLLTF